MAQFATVRDLSDFLGRRIQPDQESRARMLLELSSAAIQSETRQVLEFVADDEIDLYPGWEAVIELPQRPVVAVTEITFGETVVTDWRTARGLLYRTVGTWGGFTGPLHVVYSHGWRPIPDDVRLVCIEATARAYTMSGPDGDVQEGPGQSVMLLPWERQMLRRYRRRTSSIPVESPGERGPAWTST